MNNLEKEITLAIIDEYEGSDHPGNVYYDKLGQLAASVCMKWIEKALREASAETFSNSTGVMTKIQDVYVKAWLKENGLTPTETRY